MSWRIEFDSKAVNDLDKLDVSSRVRVIEKLEWLQSNF